MNRTDCMTRQRESASVSVITASPDDLVINPTNPQPKDHLMTFDQSIDPTPPATRLIIEILDEAEVVRRMRMLAALQETLKRQQIRSILARKHRLFLRYNDGPHEPSGMTDPELHVFGPKKHVVTIKDSAYVLDGGKRFHRPAAIAAAIAVARAAAD